jgi:hypothetical protein
MNEDKVWYTALVNGPISQHFLTLDHVEGLKEAKGKGPLHVSPSNCLKLLKSLISWKEAGCDVPNPDWIHNYPTEIVEFNYRAIAARKHLLSSLSGKDESLRRLASYSTPFVQNRPMPSVNRLPVIPESVETVKATTGIRSRLGIPRRHHPNEEGKA